MGLKQNGSSDPVPLVLSYSRSPRIGAGVVVNATVGAVLVFFASGLVTNAIAWILYGSDPVPGRFGEALVVFSEFGISTILAIYYCWRTLRRSKQLRRPEIPSGVP